MPQLTAEQLKMKQEMAEQKRAKVMMRAFHTSLIENFRCPDNCEELDSEAVQTTRILIQQFNLTAGTST